MEATRNNEVLAREAADIHVDIEPEPIYLISKDSNNRAEVKVKDNNLDKVAGASGGSLSCRTGPTPTQSLAHPAILDWATTEYLILAAIGYKGVAMDKPFDEQIGRSILTSARESFKKEYGDDIHSLVMFQNVIASSPGSQRFVFATDDAGTPIPLQHYNRCFIMKDGTEGTYHMQAAHAKVVTEAMAKKRSANSERAQQHDPTASYILDVNGVKTAGIPVGKEATVVKISGVEQEWDIMIDNTDLHLMPQERIDEILDNLDYDKYLTLFKDSFEKNWFNESPEHIEECLAVKEAAKAQSKQAKDLFAGSKADEKAGDAADSANSGNEKAESAANDAEDYGVLVKKLENVPVDEILGMHLWPRNVEPREDVRQEMISIAMEIWLQLEREAAIRVAGAGSIPDDVPCPMLTDADKEFHPEEWWKNRDTAPAWYRCSMEPFEKQHPEIAEADRPKLYTQWLWEAAEGCMAWREEHGSYEESCIWDLASKWPEIEEQKLKSEKAWNDADQYLQERSEALAMELYPNMEDNTDMHCKAEDNRDAEIMQEAGDINEGLDLPKQVLLAKQLIDANDIKKAEEKLRSRGVRAVDTHSVLRDVVRALTGTDIG